jgi:hypothetical protein
MFTNKVFGFVVCGLSFALGACAYGADESPTSEQSSELVSAGSPVLERAGSLPSLAAKDKKALEQAGEIPTFEMKGLDRVEELPGHPANVAPVLAPKGGIAGVDDAADEYAAIAAQSTPIAVERSRTSVVGEIDHEFAVSTPTFIKLTTGTLVSAGPGCKHCAR